jgi:hypothetical protein
VVGVTGACVGLRVGIAGCAVVLSAVAVLRGVGLAMGVGVLGGFVGRGVATAVGDPTVGAMLGAGGVIAALGVGRVGMVSSPCGVDSGSEPVCEGSGCSGVTISTAPGGVILNGVPTMTVTGPLGGCSAVRAVGCAIGSTAGTGFRLSFGTIVDGSPISMVTTRSV